MDRGAWFKEFINETPKVSQVQSWPQVINKVILTVAKKSTPMD